ncbi:MAG: hypothetical protein KDD44_14730, partial [Bdellovibrionales bacterium]|nr:hypothetical protein [Bdellovibrionales bacterium]
LAQGERSPTYVRDAGFLRPGERLQFEGEVPGDIIFAENALYPSIGGAPPPKPPASLMRVYPAQVLLRAEVVLLTPGIGDVELMGTALAYRELNLIGSSDGAQEGESGESGAETPTTTTTSTTTSSTQEWPCAPSWELCLKQSVGGTAKCPEASVFYGPEAGTKGSNEDSKLEGDPGSAPGAGSGGTVIGGSGGGSGGGGSIPFCMCGDCKTTQGL